MQTVPQGSTLSTSTGEEQLITKGRKLTESSGKKQMLTIIFSTFFCRGSRGSELLFPFPPLLWRRFRPGFELFGSGPLALGDRGRRGCQTQQGFHLNPPRCQKRNVSPSKAANPPAPPRPPHLPQRIHGFAARLPTAEPHVLPFVNRVQELDVHPLVHGLGITEIPKVLQEQGKPNSHSGIFIPNRKLRGHQHQCRLTLLVAEKTLFPSLNSGTNFCSRAF